MADAATRVSVDAANASAMEALRAAKKEKEEQVYTRPFEEKWVPTIHSFIHNCPPCQLGDVLTNCRRLAQAQLPKELLNRACSDHNEKGYLVLPLGDGNMGLVCEAGRAGSRLLKAVPYTDPRTGLIFTVDQEKQVVVSLSEKKTSDDLAAEMENRDHELAEPYRLSVQDYLDTYIAECYPPKDGLATHAVYSTPPEEVDGIALTIIISSRRSRPRGYWAGQWASTWVIAFNYNQSKPATLKGSINFSTHYSEDGNVHFRQKVAKLKKIQNLTDEMAFGEEVVAAIRKIEDDFQLETEETVINYGSGPLKAMRRILPLSKEKFDWKPLRHQLVKDVKSAWTKEQPDSEALHPSASAAPV